MFIKFPYYFNILDLFVKGWNEEETFAFVEKSCYTSKTKPMFYTYMYNSDIGTFLSDKFAH